MSDKTITRAQAFGQTLMQTGSLAKAAGAFVFPSGMTFSGRGSFLSIAPRNFAWSNTDPLTNSAVMQCLGWIMRNFIQAPFSVVRVQKDGTIKPAPDHPVTKLLYNPNPYYTYSQMMAAVLISYHVDGNAYLVKIRNARGFGIPTQLYYVPHWMIEPRWNTDGSDFISFYEMTVNGQRIQFPINDVIHIKQGLNPSNYRKGLGSLAPAIKEIFTDEEACVFAASLLKNQAVPGLIISMAANDRMAIGGLDAEKSESIVELFKRKFGGDKRGETMLLDFAATIDRVGFSPNDLNFEALRRIPETRIAGALGIPPVVAGLIVGNDSSTYNNLKELKKSAFEENLVPTWNNFEDVFDKSLLPDFSNDQTEQTLFDYSGIPALRENQTEIETRARQNLQAGGITVDEFRSTLGLPPLPAGAGEVFYLPRGVQPLTIEQMLAQAQNPSAQSLPPGDSEIPEPAKMLHWHPKKKRAQTGMA